METVENWNVRLMEINRERKESDKKREKSVSADLDNSTVSEERTASISEDLRNEVFSDDVTDGRIFNY